VRVRVRGTSAAIFHLAVADYMGLIYGHDGPGRSRSIRAPFRSEAAEFLGSEWAEWSADLVGLSATAIWTEARQLRDNPAWKSATSQ
jgi:hypothetical protein